MHLTTTKNKILEATLIAERIVGKKESLPVLSCVFLEAGKDLLVRATNLEAGVEIRVGADVDDKGAVAVSAAVLSQTLRSTGAEKITLKVEDGNLVVEARGTKTLIKAIPHEEFPSLSWSTSKKNISVPRGELMRGLHAVTYAASPSMIRPELGSIYISIKDDGLLCVATDSFRLAEKTLRAKATDSAEILLPLKHAGELLHILDNTESDNVAISTDESQLTATADGVQFVSRVVDGTFPNYKEIIPKSFGTEATMLKNDFADMLKKARVFSGNDQHVGLHLYPKKKIFTATAQSADVGEMSDSIDAALSGDDVDINFHIGYLADCLPSIESDSITLNFAGLGKPLVIRGISDPSFMYLVMPLNR